METKKVDLEITKYGKFIFTENPNGNYSIVKLPFNREAIKDISDVVNFLNAGLPEGFSCKPYVSDSITLITPFGEKTMVVKFFKKAIHFYGERPNSFGRFSYSSNSPQVSVNFGPDDMKVLTMFEKLYKSFWDEDFIKNKVCDILKVEPDDIYLESEDWMTNVRIYIVNNDMAFEVDMKTMKYKVIGLLEDDEDAGRRWIENVDSINRDIISLTKKRDRLINLQEKLTNY